MAHKLKKILRSKKIIIAALAVGSLGLVIIPIYNSFGQAGGGGGVTITADADPIGAGQLLGWPPARPNTTHVPPDEANWKTTATHNCSAPTSCGFGSGMFNGGWRVRTENFCTDVRATKITVEWKIRVGSLVNGLGSDTARGRADSDSIMALVRDPGASPQLRELNVTRGAYVRLDGDLRRRIAMLGANSANLSTINDNPEIRGAVGQTLRFNMSGLNLSVSRLANLRFGMIRDQSAGNYTAAPFELKRVTTTPPKIDIEFNKNPICDYEHRAGFNDAVAGHPQEQDGIVAPGAAYNLDPFVENIGDFNTTGTHLLHVQNVNSNLVSHVSMTDLDRAGKRATIFGVHRQYNNNNAECVHPQSDPGVNDCWSWAFKELAGKTSTVANPVLKTSGTFRFRVSNSAPLGSRICFRAFVRQKDSVPDSVSRIEERCFTVQNSRFPTIKVTGNDVRAGAVISSSDNGTCTDTSAGENRDVRTNDGSIEGSSGEYAVSASGVVDSFRSDAKDSDDTPPNDDLVFNNEPGAVAGGYAVICRPDLSRATPTDTINAAAVTQGMLQSYTGARIVRVNNPGGGAATTTLQGALQIQSGNGGDRQRLTLIVDGDVQITGNIEYESNYTTRNQIPAFALIATGNILIDDSVTQLDGLYVSNQIISTCADGSPTLPVRSSSSVCREPLTINGALVAKQAYFRRTRGGIGGDPAELIAFLPELYLVPPPLTANTLELTRQGLLDLPPVF